MIKAYFDEVSQLYIIERDNQIIFSTEDESLFYFVLDDLLH